MNDGFFSFTPPEFWRINKELEKEPDGPENGEAETDIFSKSGMHQVTGEKQAKYTDPKDNKGDKKCMDLHHLPVDQAERLQLFLPVKIPREEQMDSGKKDE